MRVGILGSGLGRTQSLRSLDSSAGVSLLRSEAGWPAKDLLSSKIRGSAFYCPLSASRGAPANGPQTRGAKRRALGVVRWQVDLEVSFVVANLAHEAWREAQMIVTTVIAA